MNIPNPRKRQGPEAKIQEKWIAFLRAREWMVKETHGNMFQAGFPDLFAAHAKYGARWIEVKNPESYKFTPAQREWFPQFMAAKCGIWLLFECEQSEYDKLFQPSNIGYFLYGDVFQIRSK